MRRANRRAAQIAQIETFSADTMGAIRFMNRIVSLALTMAKIGLIGFGGGNALVPVIEKDRKLKLKIACSNPQVLDNIELWYY